jgi:hypothetical protein
MAARCLSTRNGLSIFDRRVSVQIRQGAPNFSNKSPSLQQKARHSMISSSMATSVGATVRPSELAV